MSLHLLIFHTLIFHPCKFALSLNNETDRLSLIKFKESISSDPYHILDSWNSSTHFCNWHGISWGHKHHRVAQLVLDGYQLFGTISPFIGNLSFLRLIDLDNNNFHGEIPQELGLLFPLQDLYIQNNTLTGEFPINVTNCSNLKLLAFRGNHLIGKIPMEIGSLHNLEEYGMGYEVSIKYDMYNFGILILEVLTKRRSTEDMFKNGYNLHKYVESASPNNLLQVVRPTILPVESKHVAASRDFQENMAPIHPNVERCLCCLFGIGLACSMESPHERMSAADVMRELISIKRFFPLWWVHYSFDTSLMFVLFSDLFSRHI